jgi:hypothetical protein
MTVFDEVGYYATDGMAVMAAQARSLGFSLVYSAQDLPALEKRVKEEARSITANCNLKIFGKLEDPTQTKDFFEKTIGKAIVTQVSGYTLDPSSISGGFESQQQASVTFYDRASYDGLQGQKEGEAVMSFSNTVNDIKIFYCNPGHAKAMRVQKLLGFGNIDEHVFKNAENIANLRDRLIHKTWTAAQGGVQTQQNEEISTLVDGLAFAKTKGLSGIQQGAMAITALNIVKNPDALIKANEKKAKEEEKKNNSSHPDPFDIDPDDNTQSEDGLSWSDIINGSPSSENNKSGNETKDEDDDNTTEDESETSSESSDARSVALETYNVEEAIQEKADAGTVSLPDTLSDEVKNILKSAADTLTTGLFNPPTMDQYASGGTGDSRGHTAKKLSPGQQPGKTGR